MPAAASALYRFGSSILGYDCYSGSDMLPLDQFARDATLWRELTQEPRRYRFHATLKAPFHLSPACTEAQLTSSFMSFTALGHTVRPYRARSGSDRRLRRNGAEAAVRCRCGNGRQMHEIFDAFRAPMSARERARRIAADLSHSQMHNLERWGYSYLFRDFRFHMTLTGKLAEARAHAVLAQLHASFGPACGGEELAIDRLALLRQDGEQGRFRVICQAGLNASG